MKSNVLIMNSLKKYNTGFDAEVTAIVKEVAAVYKINSTTTRQPP